MPPMTPITPIGFGAILLQADRVFTAFRAGFIGKVSPVHFFWGSFDLAVTRFSGRRASQHPGAPNVSDRVTREAYSHEVSSCGFWPGGPGMEQPIFYSYAYPQPDGFAEAPVRPAGPFTTAISANSSCLMMRSVRLRHPTTHYSIFCRALTKPRPPWPNGTAPNWSELRQREPVRPAPRREQAEAVEMFAPPPRHSHRADRLVRPGQPARLLVRPGGRRMGAVAVRRRAVAF